MSQTPEQIVCPECQKVTSGKCPDHSYITVRTFSNPLTGVDDPIMAELAALRVEVETLKHMRRIDLVPCVVCKWPMHPETNDLSLICPCCGFEPGCDNPQTYAWNGRWWADATDEAPPTILANALQENEMLRRVCDWTPTSILELIDRENDYKRRMAAEAEVETLRDAIRLAKEALRTARSGAGG